MRREERRNLRRFENAYAAAWTQRADTGDGSDAVLLEALRLHHVQGFPAEGAARDVFLDLWRRGTPPSQVPTDALRAGLTLTPPVAASFTELAGRLEGPYSVKPVDLPGGRRRVSANTDWEMHALPVIYAKPATAHLGSLGLPVVNPRTGERAAQAWLLPQSEPPLADLMLGEVSIGSVRLPDQAWRQLVELESQDLVADGVVFCWEVADGVVEPDAFRCVLPR